MRKKFIGCIWILIGFFLLLFILRQINWLPNLSFLKSKPVLIDETSILVKEIKNVSQLIAIKAYDETSLDSSKEKDLPSFPGLRPDRDRIVIIAKGVVTAGMDLKKIKQEDVKFQHDTLVLKLPQASILEVVVNPSDFETFDEKGHWSDADITNIKVRIRNKILQRALSNQILDKATIRSKLVMENFLSVLGYHKVILISS